MVTVISIISSCTLPSLIASLGPRPVGVAINNQGDKARNSVAPANVETRLKTRQDS